MPTRAKVRPKMGTLSVRPGDDCHQDVLHRRQRRRFLLKQREFKELRFKLLRGASEFYRKLEVELEHQTDEPSRTALADAYSDLADLTNMVGSKEDALAIRQKARAIRQKLADDNPESTQFQADLARLRRIRRPASGDERTGWRHPSYERARRILPEAGRRQPRQHPGSARPVTHSQQHRPLPESDRPSEGGTSVIGAARGDPAEAGRREPNSTQFQADLASTLGNIGNLQNEDAGPSVGASRHSRR